MLRSFVNVLIVGARKVQASGSGRDGHRSGRSDALSPRLCSSEVSKSDKQWDMIWKIPKSDVESPSACDNADTPGIGWVYLRVCLMRHGSPISLIHGIPKVALIERLQTMVKHICGPVIREWIQNLACWGSIRNWTMCAK